MFNAFVLAVTVFSALFLIVDHAVRRVLLRHLDKCQLRLYEALTRLRRDEIPRPLVRRPFEHLDQNRFFRNWHAGDLSLGFDDSPPSSNSLSGQGGAIDGNLVDAAQE